MKSHRFLISAEEFFRGESLKWPSQRESLPSSKKLSSTFAESRSTRYHLGVDVIGNDIEVFPMQNDAQVLYYRIPGDNPFLAMPGSGNALFLAYPTGLVSGYYHLKTKSFYAQTFHSKGFPEKISRNTVVAKSGDTGRSYGAHLHFFIYDKITNVLQNPQGELLSKMTDTDPPRINYLVMIIPSNEFTEQEKIITISANSRDTLQLSRNYPLYVQIQDQADRKTSRLGIYRLSWSFNQKPAKEIIFEDCRISDGSWTCGGKKFEEAYYKNFYKLSGIDFIAGLNAIKIEAEDFAGNTAVSEFNVNISLSDSSP